MAHLPKPARQILADLDAVGVSIKELGREAGKVLLDRIENPGAPLKDVLLTPRLVVRESSSAPRTLASVVKL